MNSFNLNDIWSSAICLAVVFFSKKLICFPFCSKSSSIVPNEFCTSVIISVAEVIVWLFIWITISSLFNLALAMNSALPILSNSLNDLTRFFSVSASASFLPSLVAWNINKIPAKEQADPINK